MKKREAAIVTAYTGILIGTFEAMHEYIEEIMERPVYTHELGNEEFQIELRKKARIDFVAIQVEEA